MFWKDYDRSMWNDQLSQEYDRCIDTIENGMHRDEVLLYDMPLHFKDEPN